MTASQYEREFVTVAGSSERVEYAIKLPGQTEHEYVYLPIVLSSLWLITTVWKMLMSLAVRKRLSSTASLS